MDNEEFEDEIDRPDEMVMLGYSANSNISFHGEVSTGYTRQEWSEMRPRHRDEAIEETLYRLLDTWTIDTADIEKDDE